METVPPERSETYTVSYLAALVVLARLSAALRQSSLNERHLSELPDRVRAAAEAPALLESPPERLLVLAGAVTAREGALKLREAARLPAEGYEAEYLLHGSAAPLRCGDVFLAIQPTSDPFSLLERVAAAAAIEGLDVRTVHEPEGLHPVLVQIPLAVRLQTLASALADAQGIDPDRVIRASWAEDRLWRAGEVEPAESSPVTVRWPFPDGTEASSASRGPVGNVYGRSRGFLGRREFENDAAGDWFLTVEDPGAVMAAAIDDVLSAAEYLEVDLCCEAIAAAELCACCAGQLPDRLPYNVQGWAQDNPHGPHADEIALAAQAVSRVREESQLRELWEESGHCAQWWAEVDDLLARLGRSSAGSPPSLSP